MSEFEEIRQRIDGIDKAVVRNALKFEYVTATRSSEVVGKYAVKGNDYQIQSYEGNDLVLFSVRSAKNKGYPRYIALPLNSNYEPWTRELVKVFDSRRNKKIFPISDRTLRAYGKEAFKGISYPVETYHNFRTRKVIESHERGISTHGLRHFRVTELMMVYGFDIIDVSIFAGWKLHGMAQRYVMLQWSRYFTKLLKKR